MPMTKFTAPSEAVAAIIVGSLLRAVLYAAIPQQYVGLDTLIPPAVSLLVFVLVCLVTQNRHPLRRVRVRKVRCGLT